MAVDPGTANRGEQCHCFKNHPHFVISFNALPFSILLMVKDGRSLILGNELCFGCEVLWRALKGKAPLKEWGGPSLSLLFSRTHLSLTRQTSSDSTHIPTCVYRGIGLAQHEIMMWAPFRSFEDFPRQNELHTSGMQVGSTEALTAKDAESACGDIKIKEATMTESIASGTGDEQKVKGCEQDHSGTYAQIQLRC